MSHKIIIVGIGPGDPAYLLPKARKIIEDARILVGGKRALADHSHSGVRECAIGADIPGVLDFIRDALAEDDVVVMVSGDPGYYSLLDALRRTYRTILRTKTVLIKRSKVVLQARRGLCGVVIEVMDMNLPCLMFAPVKGR